MERDAQGLLESELVHAIREALEQDSGYSRVDVQPRIGDRLRPDLLAFDHEGRPTIIEVWTVTPQTRRRLDQAAEQLTEFRAAYRSHHREPVPIRTVLAITGELTHSYSELLGSHGIELWDRNKLVFMFRQTDSETAVRLQKILESEYRSPRKPEDRVRANHLTHRLSLPCGKANWSRYQLFCVEVLEHLFSPPLERALYENSNESKVNRRDIILPNYSADGFWQFLRSEYSADYVIVDAKNYCTPISKAAVLQVTNYMSERGTGLFAIIMCRKGDNRSSRVTRREQWILHRKMVIVLDDEDVRQALTNVEQGLAADIVLRQKIEDFRLAI